MTDGAFHGRASRFESTRSRHKQRKKVERVNEFHLITIQRRIRAFPFARHEYASYKSFLRGISLDAKSKRSFMQILVQYNLKSFCNLANEQ